MLEHTHNSKWRAPQFIKTFCYSLVAILLCSTKILGQEIPNQTTFNNFPEAFLDTNIINREMERSRTSFEANPAIAQDSTMVTMQKVFMAGEALHYEHALGTATLYLCTIYSNKGLYDRGLLLFHHALNTCIQYNMNLAATFLNNSLATMYQAKGDYQNAALYYYQALLLLEKYHFESSGGIYTNLGEVMLQLKQDKQALYFLNMAEKICMSAIISKKYKNAYWVLGFIQTNKSLLYANQKEWKKSEQYGQAALYIGQKYHWVQLEYVSQITLANIYLLTNRPQQAINYVLKAQKLQVGIDFYYQNFATRILGEAYYAIHDYDKAEQYLQEALTQANSSHLVNGLSRIYQLLSQLYTMKGAYENALKYYQAYTQLKDSITGLEVTKNVDLMEVKYRTSEKDKDIIKKQLLITQQQKWIAGIAIGTLSLVILLIVIYNNYQQRQKLQRRQIETLQQQQEIEQLKAVMEVEEKERIRIARELHDGIGGILASMKMNLSVAKEEHPELTYIKKINEFSYMLNDISTEIRKTAHNLMPDMLIQHGLKEALIIYCENNMNNDFHIDLQFHGSLENLNKNTELVLYRIIQELLQNIIKHARANHAVIQLLLHKNKLSITVEDNGLGFDMGKVNNGLGLRNVQSRVKTLQGDISIMSAEGRSTTVYIEFDYQKLIASNN